MRNITISAKSAVLFGGILNQLGWIFLSAGLISVWVVAMNADLSFIHFTGKIETVEGVATHSFKTKVSDDGDPVFENHYKFKTKEGIEYNDFSYAVDQDIESGTAITIEYPKGKPQYSRIIGMQRNIYGAVAVLFPIPFLGIGLWLILSSMKKSLRGLHLLKYGQLTKGKLISKVPTNMKINEQTVYKLTFCFQDNLGSKFNVSEETHLPHLLEDDIEEKLLYSKRNPNYAIMLDSLPCFISIDKNGNVTTPLSAEAILYSYIPISTIIGHGIYIIIRFIL